MGQHDITRGHMNRDTISRTLTNCVDMLDEVSATGDNLRMLSQVQRELMRVVEWLNPEMIDQMVDPR